MPLLFGAVLRSDCLAATAFQTPSVVIFLEGSCCANWSSFLLVKQALDGLTTDFLTDRVWSPFPSIFNLCRFFVAPDYAGDFDELSISNEN